MTRIERRVLINCVLVGVLFTSIVVLAEWVGALQVSENWMYDLRARNFQFFAKPPTTQLVHLDIDDKALEGIGRWPWPRSEMAEMLDEIHLAGAKAVATDILFSEPQDPTYEVSTAGNGQSRVDRKIDHDAELAAAMKRSGNVVVPASFEFETQAANPAYVAMVALLRNDPDLTRAQSLEQLGKSVPSSNDASREWAELFLPARREAVYQRIQTELAAAPITQDELRKKLITHSDASLNSPLSRLIDEQWAYAEAAAKLERFSMAAPPPTAAYLQADVNLAPIAAFSNVAAATAFVNFTTGRDGVLRTQPLLLNCKGRLYPQMGLSLAMLYLGATEKDLTFSDSAVTLKCPDGRQIVMPTSVIHSDTIGRDVSGIFQIPLFGNRHWETMYDWPAHLVSKQHITLSAVWECRQVVEKIRRSNHTADRALAFLAKTQGTAAPPTLLDDDVDGRVALIDRTFADGKDFLDAFKSLKPEELDDDSRAVLLAMGDLKTIRQQNPMLKAQLAGERTSLAHALGGKAVLIGWCATGHQDAVPTSLHAQCPGVVTHGAIFNAIVTGNFWRVAPESVTIAFTIALGLITAGIAWRMSPLKGFLITSAIGMTYVAVNGLYFFDHLGQIVGLAAPQIAMGSVWSGCTLARIVVESSERHRIIRRFRSYVDPNVVNYMMERPDEVRMEGETRELTVCFLDIAGFTTLSEKIGNDVVLVLNEFMDLMVPIIRDQHGTVDKLLGDGIMFFFGAPVPSSNHAADAVSTALLMQQAVGRFNADLLARGLPTIGVRIGINTGMMIVGDAGSDDYADYTVLGDNVNLASRLESANKQLGTAILISARTAELAGDRFLLRPIGSLQVVGKTEGISTYTVCGLADGADKKELEHCEKYTTLVKSFRGAKFNEALVTVNEIEETFGPNKVTGLYRILCKDYLADPPGDAFDGKIVFKEK